LKIPHTKWCKDQHEKYEKQLAEYESKWPDYCKHCNGWDGFWDQYDPSPAGVSLGSGYMLDFEPCDKCVENGKCPRCGTQTTLFEMALEDGDELSCPECRWTSNVDDKESWSLPQGPECYCYEEMLYSNTCPICGKDTADGKTCTYCALGLF
jgi:hypothetical protein